MQTWKIPHIVKGALTRLPVLNTWRQRRAGTGGTDNARYCYSVWLRHLVSLAPYGFQIKGSTIGELGPGDSIGVGLAALLSGADHYIGLDVVPFAAKLDLAPIFEELLKMYHRKERIPDQAEFPGVRPMLDSYEFPGHLIDSTQIAHKADRIRAALKAGLKGGELISYRAPWASSSEVTSNSLDLLYSQAVLHSVVSNVESFGENILSLEETYKAMALWLKPGCYTSHTIDLSAGYLSPFWNGHWAYTDREWRIVRGRREFFLNRAPLSTHLACAAKANLEVTLIKPQHDSKGLSLDALSRRYRNLGSEDLRVRGAFVILRKKS